MEDTKLPDIIEYPTLLLDGAEYKVKMTTLAALLLEREGVALSDITPGQYPLQRALTLLAACISKNGKIWTAEALAEAIPFEELPDAFRKLGVALSKVRPQAAPAAKPEQSLQ